MSKSKERFEEMRAKSRQNIMDAALKLFSSRGYHATSISAIAKEAGVAVGLMYNYFASKEELLVSIIDDFFQTLIRSVSIKMGESHQGHDVRLLIDVLIQAITAQRESWGLLISIMFQPDVSKIGMNQIRNFLTHQQDLFEKYFQERGITHPQESSMILGTILHGAFLCYAASGNLEEITLLRRTIIERLLEEGF